MKFFLFFLFILCESLCAKHFSSELIQAHDRLIQSKNIQSFKYESKKLISLLEIEDNCQISKSLIEKLKQSLNDSEPDFSRYTWRVYPTILKAMTFLDIEQSRHFYADGFALGKFPLDLAERFLEILAYSKEIPIVTEDHDENYTFNQGFRKYEKGYSKAFNFFMLEKEQLTQLSKVIKFLDPEITKQIGCNWRILNTRCWETIPNEYFVGAQDWHTDGMPRDIVKLMIYFRGANQRVGSTELIKENGEHFIIDLEDPCWFLFENSRLKHRGIPSKSESRYVVELTIAPSLQKDLTPVCAGLNAQHPIFPWKEKRDHREVDPSARYLNIGGGPHFTSPNWINLEEVPSYVNKDPFILTPTCTFPLSDEEMDIIYTSHAIEHLNMPTVYRILSECNRVMSKSGYLIIKIPDFDKALESWKKGDFSFFAQGWNIESVTPLWDQYGICDCIDHRAAMIFCSFYNDLYGNPFQTADCQENSRAYFGPPRVSSSQLHEMVHNKSPSQIAQELRNLIIEKTSENFNFCHQTAWSRDELIVLLEKFGFEVISFDVNRILSDFSFIPGIDLMKPLSTYCLAKKRN